MANLSITTSQVLLATGYTGPVEDGLSAAAITPGQAVYKTTSGGTWALAQADGTAEEAGVGTTLGIALNQTAAAGQPIRVAAVR